MNRTQQVQDQYSRYAYDSDRIMNFFDKNIKITTLLNQAKQKEPVFIHFLLEIF